MTVFKDNTLTAERVRALFTYDKDEGLLRNRVAQHSRTRVGKMAGGLDKDCYVRVGIDGRLYLAHRLIYLYVTGVWPLNEIDHENLCGFDNRWDNLRPASRAQNEANKPLGRRNTSGFKGACWYARLGKWCARIKVDGDRVYLGLFDSPEAAHKAYQEAATKYFGEFARVA